MYCVSNYKCLCLNLMFMGKRNFSTIKFARKFASEVWHLFWVLGVLFVLFGHFVYIVLFNGLRWYLLGMKYSLTCLRRSLGDDSVDGEVRGVRYLRVRHLGRMFWRGSLRAAATFRGVRRARAGRATLGEGLFGEWKLKERVRLKKRNRQPKPLSWWSLWDVWAL